MSQPGIGLWTLLELALFAPTKIDFIHRTYWETALLRDVFSPYGAGKYDNNVPGPRPINITPIIQIEHMELLEEKHGVMTMHGTLLLNWKDPRLRWNASDYGGISQVSKTRNYLKVAMAEPFIPRLYATELFTKFGDMLSNEPTMINVRNMGMISVASRFKVRTTCHFFFDKYPNDEQNCSVTLYTPMPMSQVQMNVLSYGKRTPMKSGTNTPIYVGQFLFTGVEAKTLYLLPGSYKINDPKKYPAVLVRSVGYYNFMFRRIDVLYNARMANPVFGVSLVLYALTLMPSLHAVPLLMLTMVTEVLFSLEIVPALPVDYDSMPAVAWVLTLLMFQTLVAIVWRVVYNSLEQRQPEFKEIYQWAKMIESYLPYVIAFLIVYNFYEVYYSF